MMYGIFPDENTGSDSPIRFYEVWKVNHHKQKLYGGFCGRFLTLQEANAYIKSKG